MKLYNTLTKKKEEFVPLEPGKVKMYVCGPTVYNFIHIGNARPMIVFDTARRYMEHKGYEIRHGNRLGFRLRGQERFQYPGKKMQPSQRTVSALPSLAIWRKSRRVNGPLLLTGLCFVPTADTPNTRAFWPCTFIISTCWEKSNSDSIPPG